MKWTPDSQIEACVNQINEIAKTGNKKAVAHIVKVALNARKSAAVIRSGKTDEDDSDNSSETSDFPAL